MKEKILKTSSGKVVDNDQSSQTIGKESGYTLLQDTNFIDKMAHFVRERIPERVVHAKGAGAHGYFKLNKSMSKYTDASMFCNVGTEVPLFIRMSTVGGESGSSDSARDPRGFAIKFYTEDGNYDIVGNNTPIFFIRDAIKFPDFIHTQKRHPQTNLKDANMMWDFFSLQPESLHQVMFLFSDRGTPRNYREMHGFGSHTFMWYKKDGSYVWVKYHFKSTLGFNTMSGKEADELSMTDPDHATRDLFDAIKNKNFPKYIVSVQILTDEQAKKMTLNPFDVTKVWQTKDAPLIEIGEMVLNRNPENYFVEVEQATFSPSNFIPGVGPSPDKMLQGRLFAYGDAHRYRVGTNHNQLEINKPLKCPYSNERAGTMASAEGYGSSNNYFPSTQSDKAIIKDIAQLPTIKVDDWIIKYEVKSYEDDFVQPHILYEKVLDKNAREALVMNLSGSLKTAAMNLQYRQTALFYKVHNELGTKLAKELKLDIKKIEMLSKLSQDDRIKETKFI